MEAFYQNKKVVITGGMGFLGSNLAHELVRLGAKVTIIDAMLPLYGGNEFNIHEIKDQVKFHNHDIRDEKEMQAHLKDQDVVFHIANQTSHVDSMTDPFLDVDINCRGNLIFLEACRIMNPEIKIVYIGSRAQYGVVTQTPVSENDPIRPTDIYGVNKHAGELYHAVYHQVYKMRTTMLRLSNTYGPRHQMKHGKYGIQNWMIRLAIDNQLITIYGNGNQLRDFSYVEDIVKAMLLTGSREESVGEVYNVGSGDPISFRGMIEKIVEIAGTGEIINTDWPEERKRIEVGDFVADISKIQKQLGWQPQVSLEDGLKRTIDFYRQHKAHYWSS